MSCPQIQANIQIRRAAGPTHRQNVCARHHFFDFTAQRPGPSADNISRFRDYRLLEPLILDLDVCDLRAIPQEHQEQV